MTLGGEISSMENLVIIAGAIVLLAIVLLAVIAFGAPARLLPVLCLGLPLFAYKKIRARGYFRTASAMLVLGVCIATALVLTGTIVLLPSPNSLWEILGKILICAVVTFVFLAFGCAILVRKLP